MEINTEDVRRAVAALCTNAEQVRKERGRRRRQLLDEGSEGWVYVTVALHRIVPGVTNRPQPIDVPHSLAEEEDGATADACLIVKSERDQFKEMVATGELPRAIKKVLDPAKLRANYARFEARRKLVASFDVFLVDERIEGLVPGLLGREIFKKKKLPAPVCVTGPGAKENIERALARTYLRMKIGPTATVRAAKLSFPQQSIVDNVLAVARAIADLQNVGKLRRGEEKEGAPGSNIRALFVKAQGTLAMPFFQSLPPPPSSAAAAAAAAAQHSESDKEDNDSSAE